MPLEGDRMHIDIPASCQAVLDAIEGAGFEAWLVGGCVRDAILQRPAPDIDLATSAQWEQVRDACQAAGMDVHETGTQHGTVTVVASGQPFEVTTFRIDGPYSDARHPDSIQFADSIEADLARRDFTMNALAYHPLRGLRDPFGGRQDLSAGIIRAVGDPFARFSEDALRILRGVRFASQLGFHIEQGTLDGMNAHARLLEGISAERVRAELDALLLGPHVRSALLGYARIVDTVLPELAPMRGFDQRTPYHIYDVFEHTAYVVDYAPADLLCRWAALFHDVGKPGTFFTDENGQGHFYGHAKLGVSMAERALMRLKASPACASKVALLVRYHDTVVKPEPAPVKRMLRKLGGDPSMLRTLCALKRADSLAHAPEHQSGVRKAQQIEACLDAVLEAGEAFSIAQLAIDGNDVLAAGVSPGPDVGAVLEAALDVVVDGLVPNEHEPLCTFARQQALRLSLQ